MEVKFEADSGGEVTLTPEVVRRYLVITGEKATPDQVTDQEVVLFMELCRHQRLNPFLREAYLIKTFADRPAAILVGKDALTKRAERHEQFAGFTAGVIVRCKDGTLVERPGSLVLSDFGETLVGGWAKVHRKGWSVPVENTVSISEYHRSNRTWLSMPGTMIRKVALVQALREAFPEHLSGMYTPEEMPEGATLLPVQPVEQDQGSGKEGSKQAAQQTEPGVGTAGGTMLVGVEDKVSSRTGKPYTEVRLRYLGDSAEAAKEEVVYTNDPAVRQAALELESGELVDVTTNGRILIAIAPQGSGEGRGVA